MGKVMGKLREVEGEASKRRNNETRSGVGVGRKMLRNKLDSRQGAEREGRGEGREGDGGE